MINIVGTGLNQWDTGRKVKVTDSEATHVHFANPGDSQAPILELIGGEAKIPDYLLRTGKALNAYAVLDGVTLESRAFAVRKRERPENYIYEDDQRNYIYELIDEAQQAIDNANAAAEELREAIENGEIEVTGGASTLIVSWFAEGHRDRATHGAVDILPHVESGGVVVFDDGGCFYSLQYVDEEQAIFFFPGDDHCHMLIRIGMQGEAYKEEINTVSQENFDSVIGDISNALDAIIELQEELIGV